MVENIADPLLAGIFGGDSSVLSVRSVLPRFWSIEQKYGSLASGMFEARRDRKKVGHTTMSRLEQGSSPSPPLFTTLKDGLERMVEELRKHLSGSRVHLGQRVVDLRTVHLGARPYKIHCQG